MKTNEEKNEELELTPAEIEAQALAAQEKATKNARRRKMILPIILGMLALVFFIAWRSVVGNFADYRRNSLTDEIVENNYMNNNDVAAYYIRKETVKTRYIPVDSVAANYILRDSVQSDSTLLATIAKQDSLLAVSSSIIADLQNAIKDSLTAECLTFTAVEKVADLPKTGTYFTYSPKTKNYGVYTDGTWLSPADRDKVLTECNAGLTQLGFITHGHFVSFEGMQPKLHYVKLIQS